MSEQAYCAHRNIQYAPDVRNEGTRDEWRCIICETPFVPQPKPIVTAPTPDAVQEARREVLDARDNALRNISLEAAARLDAAWDAYDALVGAAVRAECATKVRDMRTIYTNKPYSDFAQGWHEACDAITRALEAQP